MQTLPTARVLAALYLPAPAQLLYGIWLLYAGVGGNSLWYHSGKVEPRYNDTHLIRNQLQAHASNNLTDDGAEELHYSPLCQFLFSWNSSIYPIRTRAGVFVLELIRFLYRCGNRRKVCDCQHVKFSAQAMIAFICIHNSLCIAVHICCASIH